jgi:hypothetical protein
MTDVFISYKRRLRGRVEEIAASLRALGLDVWFDASLEAGSSFSAEISEKVRGARCVLVCWSDDAFPHGGDRNGWVVGEATIGRERNVLVPVLLDRADLDPPWNTLHTEDLSRWSPEVIDQSPWHATLASIGRLVDRPRLADEDRERRGSPDYVPAAPRSGPTVPQVIVAGLAGAVMTAIGAVIIAAVDPTINWAQIEGPVGAALAATPLALLYWRTGKATPLRAAGLIAASVVAYLAGTWLGFLVIQPMRTNPALYDLAEIIICAIGGLLGGGLSLGAFPLLGLADRGARTGLKIGVSAIALSAIAGTVAAMPFFSFVVPSSSVIWLAAVWQLAYAVLLGWVVRRSE